MKQEKSMTTHRSIWYHFIHCILLSVWLREHFSKMLHISLGRCLSAGYRFLNLGNQSHNKQKYCSPKCPLRTIHCVPQEKFSRKPYKKFFIAQVCLVKMVGYWTCSFFASLWTLTLVHKHAKKELGQYSAILTSHLVNNPYIL